MSRIVRGLFANGVQRTWQQLYHLADVKVGVLVGADKFGNKYYESHEEDLGRERWVEYAKGNKADASEVPAEWHMWLHRMNDAAPAKVDLPYRHFQTEFQANLSGTSKAYVPYSTTVPKIQPWTPRVEKRQ